METTKHRSSMEQTQNDGFTWIDPQMMGGEYQLWVTNDDTVCNQTDLSIANNIIFCLRWSPLTLWVWIPLKRGVLDTTLWDKVCQWLAAGQRFSPGTPVSSTNKIDCHDISEILLKVALNTINQTSLCILFYIVYLPGHQHW